MHAEKCPVCKGTGEPSSPAHPHSCHGCHGTGWIEVSGDKQLYPSLPHHIKKNWISPPGISPHDICRTDGTDDSNKLDYRVYY